MSERKKFSPWLASVLEVLVLASYVAGYFLCVRPSRGLELKGGRLVPYVDASYGDESELLSWFFAPAHWLDRHVVRPTVWKW